MHTKRIGRVKKLAISQESCPVSMFGNCKNKDKCKGWGLCWGWSLPMEKRLWTFSRAFFCSARPLRAARTALVSIPALDIAWSGAHGLAAVGCCKRGCSIGCQGVRQHGAYW